MLSFYSTAIQILISFLLSIHYCYLLAGKNDSKLFFSFLTFSVSLNRTFSPDTFHKTYYRQILLNEYKISIPPPSPTGGGGEGNKISNILFSFYVLYCKQKELKIKTI